MTDESLSGKREKLFNQTNKSKCNKNTILRILKKDIEKQDKEAVKKLKDELDEIDIKTTSI